MADDITRNERLDREAVVRELVRDIGDTAILAGLGTSTSNLATSGDRDLNFYFIGAMGATTGVGLGVALAQPERQVMVITGDGELMMNSGILATIGVQQPSNLAVIVLDNGVFGETGLQPSHTSFGIDIAGIAAACGFRDVMRINGEHEIPELVRRSRTGNGPFLAVVRVKSGRYPNVIPLKSGVELKARFSRALKAEG
jgi:thiamine pyrophosphate-dependent acetolactate synthase large subunit-like protein